MPNSGEFNREVSLVRFDVASRLYRNYSAEIIIIVRRGERDENEVLSLSLSLSLSFSSVLVCYTPREEHLLLLTTDKYRCSVPLENSNFNLF